MVDSRAPSEDVLVSDASATVIGEHRPAALRELELPRGSPIGRYVVLSRLGAGAMGVVVAAYDPELDRKVALKLLHPREDRRAHVGHRRLLAEAQALARLSDPNVVTVHDVGVHEGRVFVAMEFVAGQTLKAWLAAASRPWSEVLDVMTRAGRGLAAAHARELVHRDFKPENVMLGDDGRVRVMDFGLARAEADTSNHDDDIAEVTGSRQRALGLQLTQLGALVGTPAYMAPEQLVGGRGGPAADQFSFCTSLWEALYGQRPFVDETLPGLQARILMGQITKPPAGVRVPRWLRRVVEQGLEVDPARRWPTMCALLDALEHGRKRARRRRIAAPVGLSGLLGLGLVGWRLWDEHRRVRACEAEGAAITQVWNDEVAEGVSTTLARSGFARAETTALKVRPWLDARARDWQAARTEVCIDARVRGELDPELLDRARWCLDDRREELAGLVSMLSSPDEVAVDRAVMAAMSFDEIAACRDVERLARRLVPPPEQRDVVRQTYNQIVGAELAMFVGDYDGGLALARRASESAERIGWLPLVALAHYEQGVLLVEQGDYAQAEAMLERSYFEAFRADDIEVAMVVASRLAYLLSHRLSRITDARRWGAHAELLVSRLPEEFALEHLGVLGAIHSAAGELEQFEAVQEQLAARQESMLGPEHPELALTLGNLAVACYKRGGHARAKELFQRVIQIQEQALGPEHPWLASSYDNLGLVVLALGDAEGARVLHERALAIGESVYGPEHSMVAATLTNLGVVAEAAERYDEAVAMHERAVAIWEATLGPEHPDVALGLQNLAAAHRLAGRLEQARALYQRALPLFEAALGPEHPDVALPLHGLALLALAQARPADAVPLIERAVRLREAAKLGPDMLAGGYFTLAQALWDADQDRTRALESARRALVDHRERGETGAEDAAAVEQWLAEHPLSAAAEGPSQEVGPPW